MGQQVENRNACLAVRGKFREQVGDFRIQLEQTFFNGAQRQHGGEGFGSGHHQVQIIQTGRAAAIHRAESFAQNGFAASGDDHGRAVHPACINVPLHRLSQCV